YIRKGTRLFVEGKLRTRTWEDRTAIKRTVTEIYVENYDILSRTPSGYDRPDINN
ncbi:MAG: single-stranded DNA-binding protein, partial [Muribaculaceae bacterium]|nr:single-stranded DNA-binding protein [Muribaculaceae bacterium]